MDKKNYGVLFRGHDHDRGIICRGGDGRTRFMGWKSLASGHQIHLREDMRHIVNVGAFCDGDYALVDKDWNVEFRNFREV